MELRDGESDGRERQSRLLDVRLGIRIPNCAWLVIEIRILHSFFDRIVELWIDIWDMSALTKMEAETKLEINNRTGN